jgi:Tfp pilus assembly pilus retraction ATPase PilT
VLLANPAIANLIATAKSNQIDSALETGVGQGMHTLEHDLAKLWVAGRITEQTATTMSRNPAILRDRATMFRKDTVRPAAR